MPNAKRKVIDDSSDEEEEIVYVLGKRSLKHMPLFLKAIEEPFWQLGVGPDEDSTDPEKFLFETLCTKPGEIDVEKIMELLKEDHNHLPVMEALECILGYDMDMRDVEDFANSNREVDEIQRIVRYLPKWAKIAANERERKKRRCE